MCVYYTQCASALKYCHYNQNTSACYERITTMVRVRWHKLSNSNYHSAGNKHSIEYQCLILCVSLMFNLLYYVWIVRYSLKENLFFKLIFVYKTLSQRDLLVILIDIKCGRSIRSSLYFIDNMRQNCCFCVLFAVHCWMTIDPRRVYGLSSWCCSKYYVCSDGVNQVDIGKCHSHNRIILVRRGLLYGSKLSVIWFQ